MDTGWIALVALPGKGPTSEMSAYSGKGPTSEMSAYSGKGPTSEMSAYPGTSAMSTGTLRCSPAADERGGGGGPVAVPAWAPKAGAPLAFEPVPGCPEDTLTPQANMRYSPIIDDIIAAAREGRRPKVSLHDGRQAQEMVQAIYESHVQGRKVPLPLADRSHPLKRWS